MEHTASTVKKVERKPVRANLYYRWPSGKIEHISGTVMEDNEQGVRMRYHNWSTGVTCERFFTQNTITNYQVTHWN